MDSIDEMHEISFSGSDASSPSQSPRKPAQAAFAAVPTALPPMRALAVGGLTASVVRKQHHVQSNTVGPYDDAEIHIPARGTKRMAGASVFI